MLTRSTVTLSNIFGSLIANNDTVKAIFSVVDLGFNR